MKAMFGEYWLFINYYFKEIFFCRKCISIYFVLFFDFLSILVCFVDILNNCWFIYRLNLILILKIYSYSRLFFYYYSRLFYYYYYRRSYRSRYSEDMVDFLVLSNTELKRFIFSFSISRRVFGKSGGFRNWNFFMFGIFLDDFLRLIVLKFSDLLLLDGFLSL